jgi:hypothetical protein
MELVVAQTFIVSPEAGVWVMIKYAELPITALKLLDN